MDIIEKIEQPMDDSTIRQYLPNPKIITNKDLNKINDINDLFDKKNYVDYNIILFLDDINKGHWTSVLKYGDEGNGIIEFFDSYGKSPEEVYKYCPMHKRKRLGTEKNKLCDLLNKCNYDVIYNPIKYQGENNEVFDVNTCGRHICNRVLNLIGKGKTLPEYYDLMKEAKKYYNEPYDVIVSKIINL
jgi:hypothetical protein